MNKYMKYIRHPKNIIIYLMNKNFFRFVSDKKYLKFKYKLLFGKKMNLDHPHSFNEKLNWLKIYDRNDLYTLLADKILVKKYVEQLIGKKYIIPLYKVYNNSDEININDLPDQFVLKCNHDSGGAFICKNKDCFNIMNVKKKLSKNLKKNWFWSSREWPYKNINSKILVEKYIEDPTSDDLIDYKFLCFNGEPKYVYTTVKSKNIYENYYDMNFKKVDINHGYPRRYPEFSKPKNFDKMILLVKKLCINIPFVRIDMHNIDGKIFFGEFTFYDWAGFKPYLDNSDEKLGKLLSINKK